MRALPSLSARLAATGLCLIAALAGACSFDESQLRPAPDGAIEHPVILDASAPGSDGTRSISPDASTGVGGNRGSTDSGGDGGIGVGDAAVPPDLAKAVDVAVSGDRAPVSDVPMDAPLSVDAAGPPTSCSPVPKSTGGIACPGGKCTVGPYSGSSFAVSDKLTSTICLSTSSLCAAGTTNPLKSPDISTNWGATFGFFLRPESTTNESFEIQLTGTGVSVTLSSLPTGAQARVQLTTGNLASSVNYCTTMTSASQTFPWASFNTACWDDSGMFLSGTPTNAKAFAVQVSSEAGVAGSFDLCVTSVSFPGS